MISVKQVSGGYNNINVIHNISFQVAKGELFGIIGPNGSGKTTLLKMLSQILTPEKGHINLKGKQLATYTSKQLAKLMAVLPQQMMQTDRKSTRLNSSH